MNESEKLEIKGRTDAMEWVSKLVLKWRKQHKEFEEWRLNQPDPEAHVDLYEEFADDLEKHIAEFANC